MAMPAFAGTFDTIHPYVAFIESYDANLLGLSNSTVAQEVLGSVNTGDRSHTEQVGISFDDTIGLQHFTGDVSEAKTSFERFTPLDHDAANVQGNWNWYVGNHLYGNLGTSYAQSLAPFTYFHLLKLNMRSLRKENGDVTWLFHPSWAAVGELTGSQLGYELPAEQPFSRNEYHATGGIDYLASSGSTFGVRVGHIRGYFPFPQVVQAPVSPPTPEQPIPPVPGMIDVFNNYSQDEIKAKIDWLFSGKTHIQFLGGRVERKYEFLPAQDYRGFNGRAIAEWSPAGKLTFTINTWHEIAAVDDLTTVYSTNHGISIAPAWVVSDLIRWDAKFKFEECDFAQSPTLSSAPTAGVTYLLHNASLTLTYSPTPHVQIQSMLYYQTQSTSNHANDFGGNGVMVSSRYQF